MIVRSDDISEDKVRGRFARMLIKHGAMRIQYAVYEVVNTRRVIDNMKIKIESYAKHFSAADSVIVFEVQQHNLIKYGNAVHRDVDVVYL